MKTPAARSGLLLAALAAFSSSALITGCQTTIGGQTLPSPNYLDDDVQYHPAGPEHPLANQIQAAQKYKAEQDAL